MADSPTFLPVYSLPENTNPTTSDSLVIQASGATGDVGLITVGSFFENFANELIDSATITAFIADGWVTPT